MGDDRPLDTPEQAIARLTARLADLENLVNARSPKSPTGTIELAFRAAPKPGTLFLIGGTVSRTTYPDLWAWANDVGAIVAGGFTVGDGSTTFGLPDFRGRVPIGAGTLGSDTYALGAIGGAAARTLTIAQMPAHDHDLTGGGGIAYGVGDHGGHNSGAVSAAGGTGVLVPNNSQVGNGAHDHDVQTEVFSLDRGGGAAFDNRMPYLAVNVAIWF